jgi:hypothetical protein
MDDKQHMNPPTGKRNGSNKHPVKKVLRRLGIAIAWISGIFVGLLTLALLALQFRVTQDYLTGRVVSFLSSKINTTVRLDEISISFPKNIGLKSIYVESRTHDTLLYLGKLEVNINLLRLFKRQISVNSVLMKNGVARVKRTFPDTLFNYDFIIASFAPPGPAKKEAVKDTVGNWLFSLGQVRFENVQLSYHDELTGVAADMMVGELESEFGDFDLLHERIGIKSTVLANTSAALVLTPSRKKKTADTTRNQFNVDVGNVDLRTVNFSFADHVNGQDVTANIGTLELRAERTDIVNLRFLLKKLSLANSQVAYVKRKEDVRSDTTTGDTSSVLWNVSVKEVNLNNNDLQYDNQNSPHLKRGLDYQHLSARHVNLRASDFVARGESIALHLREMSLEEKSGFSLKQFRGLMEYDQRHISVKELHLETPYTQLSHELGIQYTSLAGLADSIGQLGVTARLSDSRISMKDVLLFAPQLAKDSGFHVNPLAVIRISGDVNGTLNDLVVKNFILRSGSSTRVLINGSVKQVMDPLNMYVNLDRLEVASGRYDVDDLLPGLVPLPLCLPDTFSLKGNYTGYLKNCDAELEMESSSGNIIAFVKMNPQMGNVLQPYSGRVDIARFNLGNTLGQRDLGAVTMHGTIRGSGFDSTMNAALDVVIDQFTYRQYDYKKIIIDGAFTNRSFKGSASAKDKNLAFRYDGTVDFSRQSPEYAFTLDLEGADLRALHMTKEDVRVKALITSDIGTDPNHNLSGYGSVRNLLVIHEGKKYPLDSIVFKSKCDNGVTDMTLASDILSAHLKGAFSMEQIAPAVNAHLQTYFRIPGSELPHVSPQQFEFEFNLSDPSMLTGNLLPSLEKLSPFTIKGNFDSRSKMSLQADVPQVKYSGVEADSVKVEIESGEQLKYLVAYSQVSSGLLKTENGVLSGDAKNNLLRFGFNTARDDSATLLGIGGHLQSGAENYTVSLNRDLTFHAVKWQIDSTNYAVIGKAGWYVNQLVLTGESQALSVNSSVKEAGAPVEIKFKDFNIETVSRVIENGEQLLKGVVNGHLILEKQENNSAFRSDLVITDFIFRSVPVGTVKLQADNFEDPLKYQVTLDVRGFGNELLLNGAYGTGKNDPSLDFALDVHRLELKTIEPFTFGQVSRMTGQAHGKVNIGGTLSHPALDGKITMNESALKPRILDSYLSVPEGDLVFSGHQLRLNNFTLIDTLSDKATLNGSIDFSNLKDPAFNLRLKSGNFLALNTGKADNPLYYGRIFLDSDVKIGGTASLPVIDVNARVNKGSSITYVKPESLASKNESKGIVEFTDSLGLDSSIMARRVDSGAVVKGMKGVNLSAAVNIDRDVVIKMIVDPLAGDSLYLRGGGLVNFTLDETGKTGLTGKYNISEGGYYLTINEIVRRSFQIERGSSVTWAGDPLDAYVNLTAVYKIKTSPLDLMQNELAGMSELEKNKYRNSLNFLVYLKMTGYISAPEISFDIQLAPGDKGAAGGAVNSRLAQLKADESQMNKQVFALLTLRRFVGENPLESAGDGGFSSAGRSSASKVLTQQLSSLSDRYVNFVDLDVGVNSFEDYSQGRGQGRTQLQLGVSKQLFNDKVTVRVGGNIELEGEKAQQNNANDMAGNISIEYKLTDDGRYKLKAFRQNQYENPIEGELTKTGAGVVFIRNFTRFRELLKKPHRRDSEKKEGVVEK